MDKKTIWNCHILDKLYWVHKSGLSVEDCPIVSIEIDERVVRINNLKPFNEVSVGVGSKNDDTIYYLNKNDAVAALITYIASYTKGEDISDVNNDYHKAINEHYGRIEA